MSAEPAIFALGHDLGRPLDPQTMDEEYAVRFRGQNRFLTKEQYITWRCAHGYGDERDNPEWTRTDTVAAAAADGVQPQTVIDWLLRTGLLIELDLRSADVLGYAAALTATPRLVATGLVPDEPGWVALGAGGQPVAVVPQVVFEVLLWAPLHGSLLATCESVVRRFTAAGSRDRLCTDVRAVVSRFFMYAQPLMMIGALSLDMLTEQSS